jgi:hypothetical protein
LKPAIDLESIENRMVIRNAVQRGDIETAVGWVNELDPEVNLQVHLTICLKKAWETSEQ